jgi:hypothetical protein
MTSPTPYWSSTTTKMPARKSLIRFWAPKPRATPAIPAEARIGPSDTPISPRIITIAVVKTMTDTPLLRTEPSAWVRCIRRSPARARAGSTVTARRWSRLSRSCPPVAAILATERLIVLRRR